MIMKSEKHLWMGDQGDGTYTNPILYTDYSDPDVIRVGKDYYMVASSFCNTPAVPVLHSKDLVNWKVISYAMEQLPFSKYDKPMHGCGAWAPSIRYYGETFYIFIPMPDEGVFMVKSKDPFHEWDEPVCVKKVIGWIDPCPFFDDDGKAYMVSAFARSRIGFKSILHLSPLKEDCTEVLDDGHHIFDGTRTQPTIEGPKLYKRNGYYYIFAPAGGVKTGWQTVLRAKNIWGPYEERIVLHQGNTSINGPHQGAWVDTPSGEDWFIHFQDVGNAGRVVHLQPMHWEDDWPIIGVNHNEYGCGEPVSRHHKPKTEEKCERYAPKASDYFEQESLGLQWQWNANHKKEWFSLDEGKLALNVIPVSANIQICDIPNLLLQKWPAPEFLINTLLHIEGMTDGDLCGMVCLGGVYTAFFIKQENGSRWLVQRTGEWQKQNETETICGKLETDFIYIRMQVLSERQVTYYYSTDGEVYLQVGNTIEVTPGRWVGVKSGLFAVREENGNGGYMKVEYFVFDNA